MSGKCNLRNKWKIQIENDLYEIEYEGYFDDRSHFLTINGEKKKMDIPVEIRNRKYDNDPYKYVFEIDGLELTMFLREEDVFLLYQWINLDNCIQFVPTPIMDKATLIVNVLSVIFCLLLPLGLYLKNFYNMNPMITLYLATIVGMMINMIKWYLKFKYNKKITWIKDDKGRIVQFKQDFEKIIGIKK